MLRTFHPQPWDPHGAFVLFHVLYFMRFKRSKHNMLYAHYYFMYKKTINSTVGYI